MKITRYTKKIAVILMSVVIGGCSLLGGKSMKSEEHFEPELIALIEAIEDGNKEQAQILIDQGLDLNVRAQDGVTPLVYFMANKDLDAMELALQLEADPNYHAYVYRNGEVYYEKSPLAILSDGGSTEMFELLLKYGANPNTVDHRKVPILFNVIGQDDWDKYKLIFEYGGDVNIKDYRGRRASIYSAVLFKYDFVIDLIEKGDNIYDSSENGDTLGFTITHQINRKKRMPNYRLPDDLFKAKSIMEEKGVKFPALGLKEVRERKEKGLPIQ